MRKFLSGLVIGRALSLAAAGYAASVRGGDGWLSGWTVTPNGRAICGDLYVRAGLHHIQYR